MRLPLFRIVFLLILTSCAASAAGATQWHRYTNVRYGYSICYPALLRPQPEPDAGDGRKFVGIDMPSTTPGPSAPLWSSIQ